MADKPFVPLDFPPWLRWGRRKGAILPQPAERGPTGRRLCRWCHAEVSGRRLSWCGDECAKRFLRVFTWAAVREYVVQRDRVCQRCGCDWPGWRRMRGSQYVSVHSRNGWYSSRQVPLTPWWEVDHVARITDGATDDPANLRLLCHACHVAVGYEQRAQSKLRKTA